MPLVMPQYDEDQYTLDTNALEDDMRDDEIDDSIQDHRPRLMIMGMRRSGKSSIKSVVFQGMQAGATLYLESTNTIIKENITSFIDFQVWDFPGQLDYLETDTFDSSMIFGEFGALIFVIDSQDDYTDAVNMLVRTVEKAYSINPNLIFVVLIHKVDSLSDEFKIEVQRDIQKRAAEDLEDFELHNKISLNFYLTSIYDHSIFESFSKVIQKLIPQMPTLENLLNVLCMNSGIDKAFLFDIQSKIYIATDSSPVDMQSYEICCDMIDIIFDVSEIYGKTNAHQSADNDKWPERECTADASSFIKLNNDMVLCLKGVNRFLALVCLFQSDNLEKHGLIEYNFQCFKQAISNVFDLKHRGTERLRHSRMETPEEDIDEDDFDI